jgi:soluble lytic murein transglycosylase-like protein
MVRRAALVAALVGLAGAAHAEGADWRAAGGAIFAGLAPFESAGFDPVTTAPTAPDADVPRVPTPQQPYADAVIAAADRYGLDPKLLSAVVAVESGYRARAVSRAGAAGLTQLMPGTATALGVTDRFDPAGNLFAGSAYLALQLRRFGDLRLALAAYNAGPERVARLGRLPALTETRQYVAAVIDCYLALAAGRGVRTSRDCPAGDLP